MDLKTITEALLLVLSLSLADQARCLHDLADAAQTEDPHVLAA